MVELAIWLASARQGDAAAAGEVFSLVHAELRRLAPVEEMRYLGDLTEAEPAQALDLSERTVRRDWEKARLLLVAGLEQGS